ncbi:MAG: hypothetical protein L0229_30535 [Blastocatellia bacterium]|nr:hypothetical protein [Blastocatellia bacterium]
MRDEHVIKMLEEKPLGSLSESELDRISSHISHCSGCARAYDAARAQASMLKARASEVVEPPPFFNTRVMAAIRDTAAAPEQFAFSGMWKAARALVSSMVVLVVVLLTLTLFISQVQTPEADLIASDIYSAEWVVLQGDDIADDDISYGDVLTTLYDGQEAYEEYK